MADINEVRQEEEDARQDNHDGNGSGARELIRQFSPAAQPEVMRAAEKDDHYASYVYDACHDAFRHVFGTRLAVAFQNETKLVGQMLYYLLTTGSGLQTLGEEYCDVSQRLQVLPDFLQPQQGRYFLFSFKQLSLILLKGLVLRLLHVESCWPINILMNHIVDLMLEGV
eukprot:Gb_11591 [translate_table: standard]